MGKVNLVPDLPIEPPNLSVLGKIWLNNQLVEIENKLNADVLCFVGPIEPGLDDRVRIELEKISQKGPRSSLVVIMETNGGIIQVVERLVTVFRTHYNDVRFLIPTHAMSAGTVLAMSGDAIMMSYYSLLGPIDPQVKKDDKFVPALSYLHQYESLMNKAASGELNQAELALLLRMDIAELDIYRLAREMSKSLIVQWLSEYKFKDWSKNNQPVSVEQKKARAEEIADLLNNQDQWKSHGRGINMKILREEIGLKIDDFGSNPELYLLVYHYISCLKDFMQKHNIHGYVDTRLN